MELRIGQVLTIFIRLDQRYTGSQNSEVIP